MCDAFKGNQGGGVKQSIVMVYLQSILINIQQFRVSTIFVNIFPPFFKFF